MYTELFETVYPINSKKERGVTVSGVDAFGLGEAIGLAIGDRVMKATRSSKNGLPACSA